MRISHRFVFLPRVFVWLFATVFLPAVALAQKPTFTQEQVNGRDAFVLENSKMRVSALRGAGHIGEIRLKSSDPKASINPMRVAHFPTIDPWDYDPAKHDPIYGGGTARSLQSGYMGQLLNFPQFGGPSVAEAAQGLGDHGEALAVEWKKDRAETAEDAVQLWYSAHLPKNQYSVGRVLTLPQDETVLYIEEWVENLTAFDRPAHWVEHVTFGPPFVEPGKNVLDMSGTRGEVRAGASETDSLQSGPIRWPEGTAHDGKKVSLRAMQPELHRGTYFGVLMDQSRERNYFTMYHTEYKVLIGYIWLTKDFPWIGDWQENKRNTGLPWEGKVIARGLEFGTTPFGGTMKSVLERGNLFGVPLYRWIAARERATTRYVAFLSEIPVGFQGVEDVRVGDGKIVITERGSGKTITLKSERQW
jgi:hypothetical protein